MRSPRKPDGKLSRAGAHQEQELIESRSSSRARQSCMSVLRLQQLGDSRAVSSGVSFYPDLLHSRVRLADSG